MGGALLDHAHDVHSQFGEDGVLAELLRRLGIERGWCCEFGAYDGVHLSNTRLLLEQGWGGLLIEGEPGRFVHLQNSIADLDGVTGLNRMVGFTAPDDLDTILDQAGAPEEPDLLSIDIDGNDYHVWAALERHRPKVVVVEFNPTFPNWVEFVQPADMSLQQGSSIASLVELGKRKGYEAAAVTDINGIFVREDLFERLGVEDNRLETLRTHHNRETALCTLYDGTIVLRGHMTGPWNSIELSERRVQVLPRPLRVFTPGATPRQRRLQRAWAWWYRHRP